MSAAALAWALIGVCAVASLILVAIGVVRCVGPAKRLRQRAEAYKDLPLARGIAATQARLELTQARLAEADAVLAQASAALESMQASLGELVGTFGGAFAMYTRAADNVRAVRSAFSRAPRAS